jgi:hypothetical protein
MWHFSIVSSLWFSLLKSRHRNWFSRIEELYHQETLYNDWPLNFTGINLQWTNSIVINRMSLSPSKKLVMWVFKINKLLTKSNCEEFGNTVKVLLFIGTNFRGFYKMHWSLIDRILCDIFLLSPHCDFHCWSQDIEIGFPVVARALTSHVLGLDQFFHYHST